MEFEEIDEKYNTNIKKANEFFLTGLKMKRNKKDLEKEYKKKLKEANDQYRISTTYYLKKHKDKKKLREKKEEKNEEEIKPFKKKLFQSLSNKLKYLQFILKIKVKRLHDRLVSGKISYETKKLKLTCKHELSYFIKLLKYFTNLISTQTIKVLENINGRISKKIQNIEEKVSKNKKIIFDSTKKIFSKKDNKEENIKEKSKEIQTNSS